MDDKSKMIEQLAGLLGGEKGMQSLSSMLQGLMTTPSPAAKTPEESIPEPVAPVQSSLPAGPDMDKLQNMLSNVTMDNDPRINLLSALMPYMGGKRSGKMQNAVKAIKMTKIIGLMGNVDKI